MENENFSTSYVPLQPPYMIIKYCHKIGMQIGTFIVTKHITGDAKHPIKIETHSFPIVANDNKEIIPQDKNLFSYDIMEGIVWDTVELKNVSNVCKSNSHLSWAQFTSILWSDHYRFPATHAIQKHIFKVLKKYGVTVDLPIPGIYTIHLFIESHEGQPVVVRSREYDVFAMNAAWNDNVNVIEGSLVTDLISYLDIISPNRSANGWKLNYETTDERLTLLVEKLNANRKATSFHHVVIGSFVISAIMPYDEENTNKDIRRADTGHPKNVIALFNSEDNCKEFFDEDNLNCAGWARRAWKFSQDSKLHILMKGDKKLLYDEIKRLHPKIAQYDTFTHTYNELYNKAL